MNLTVDTAELRKAFSVHFGGQVRIVKRGDRFCVESNDHESYLSYHLTTACTLGETPTVAIPVSELPKLPDAPGLAMLSTFCGVMEIIDITGATHILMLEHPNNAAPPVFPLSPKFVYVLQASDYNKALPFVSDNPLVPDYKPPLRYIRITEDTIQAVNNFSLIEIKPEVPARFRTLVRPVGRINCSYMRVTRADMIIRQEWDGFELMTEYKSGVWPQFPLDGINTRVPDSMVTELPFNLRMDPREESKVLEALGNCKPLIELRGPWKGKDHPIVYITENFTVAVMPEII